MAMPRSFSISIVSISCRIDLANHAQFPNDNRVTLPGVFQGFEKFGAVCFCA